LDTTSKYGIRIVLTRCDRLGGALIPAAATRVVNVNGSGPSSTCPFQILDAMAGRHALAEITAAARRESLEFDLQCAYEWHAEQGHDEASEWVHARIVTVRACAAHGACWY
jgi:hypothetical protein